MFRNLILALAIICLPIAAFSQVSEAGKPVKVITDADIGAYNYWYSDTVYNLQGFCYVEDGEILVIEPGTIIKGNEGQGANATALVVARGGRIYAEGTEAQPIIFTTIIDNVDDPNDIPLNDARGKWGGLIILGRAIDSEPGGTDQIEGIDPLEPRGIYGGNDDNDNSGVIKYVSIRHGGSEIGAGNEINGLTLGAVGRGTTISHVEVFYNLDDGYEFFGGCVNTDHLVAAFCGDDAFDYDEGFRGTGQFWFCIQDSGSGDRGGEHDGGDQQVDARPFATPLISNVTYIGQGTNVGTNRTFEIRDNAGTAYFNSIFTEFGGYGVNIESVDPLTEPTDSQDRLATGMIKFYNNIWYGFGVGNTATAISNSVATTEAAIFTSGNDYIFDPVLAGVSRTPNNGLNPRPTSLAGWARGWVDPNGASGFDPETADTLTAYPNAINVVYPTFEAVNYPGAFDPNSSSLWICNWTALSYYGYLTDQCSLTDCACITDDNKPVIPVTDDSVGTGAGSFTYWNSDNVYNLTGFVFVDNGDTLVIGPGTIVKGNEGQGANASALIVARGGTIIAVGSPTCPVVFTSIIDDVDDPFDIPLNDARGKWGGLILLGAAHDNEPGGTDQIEGIDPLEPRGSYGGNDDDDSSGSLRYVSIRHGGSEIGAGNEINGLTLGAVGRGTTISHIEVFYNLDDGYEFFGGCVNTDHLIAAFCGDDAFDYDEGFRGTGQFWFCLQDSGSGDRGGEHDGGDQQVDARPFATPLISNVTYIGQGTNVGTNRTFEIRDNAGSSYFNSIFTQFGGYGINIESVDPLTEPTDSQDRLATGMIKFYNNIWYGFGAGNTATAICNSVATTEAAIFTSGNDFIFDPSFASVDRGQNGLLNPLPTSLAGWTRGWVDPTGASGFNPESADTVTAYPNAVDIVYPNFEVVDYPGAFDPNVPITQSWLAGWTFLSCGGFIGDVSGSCCQLRGNVNAIGGIDIADVTYLVAYAFKGGPPPPCDEEGNVNGIGGIDIADVTYLVSYAFKNGPNPPPCAKSGGVASAWDYVNDNSIEVAIDSKNGKTTVSLSTPVELNGVQVDMFGTHYASVKNMVGDELELYYHEEDGYARIGVFDIDGKATIEAGTHVLAEINGEFEGLSAIVSDKNNHGVIPALTTSGGDENLPHAYSLQQNYPNPFNPSTEISFSLPQTSKVELTVYNVLGQKVNTLVNSELEAGVHTVTWDGTDYDGRNVASTMYFYRLQAGNFSETKKMLLLK